MSSLLPVCQQCSVQCSCPYRFPSHCYRSLDLCLPSPEFRETFLLLDNKGDKKIGLDQVGDAMRAFGLNPTESDIQKILAELDPQSQSSASCAMSCVSHNYDAFYLMSNSSHYLGNERVQFDEFLPHYVSLSQKKEYGSLGDFTDGLKVFEKDGSGFIDSAELRHVLSSLGNKTRGGQRVDGSRLIPGVYMRMLLCGSVHCSCQVRR